MQSIVVPKEQTISKLCLHNFAQQKVITIPRGPFIYYIITFLGSLDPLPPLRQHVFSTKNKQKLAFSDPPPPYKYLHNI